MNKIRKLTCSLCCVVLLCSIFVIPASAGQRDLVSSFVSASGELNNTEWNSTDENIVFKDGKLMIPGDTSTGDSKFISKNVGALDTSVKNMISASMKLKLTELPKGEKFILGFGLQTIEAYPEETGNVEIIFENNSGITVSVVAYGAEGAVTILDSKKCGVSMNKDFSVEAKISSESVMTLQINGSKLVNEKLPVTGEGRFGIIQTGSCGAVISQMVATCSYYDRPENTNIDEQFENGEFNANVLVSQQTRGNGIYPSYLKLEKYGDSNVLMYRNTGLAFFGTKHKYSNFEISFDIPYYLRENVYNEAGELIGKPCEGLCIGIGEDSAAPAGDAYVTDMDLIIFGPTSLISYLAHKYHVYYDGLNLFDPNTNEGFSVKLTVIDGHSELQLKPLKSGTYKTVATAYYENFRSGYINIWTTGNSNVAIDNLKITNLDKEPNLIDVEYKSSIVVAEDYQLTKEDTELIFRDEVVSEDNQPDTLIVLIAIIGVVAIVGIVLSIFVVRSKRRRKGGLGHEEN